MPTPLAKRVRAGVLAAYSDSTPAQVPDDNRLERLVFGYVPDRDGVPALIVSATPNASPQNKKMLRWQETTYPVTATLVSAQDGRPQSPDPKVAAASADWRDAWVDAVIRLRPAELDDVPEVVRVQPNPDILLDLTAYSAANLWVCAVNLLVTCRESL